MILDSFPSLCEERQRIIKSKDKGSPCEHVAMNNDKQRVRHYQVDGVLFQSTDVKKCDFLVINDDKKNAYFIELKGSNILDAIGQLENAHRLLADSLIGYVIHYRIVSKPNTHAIHSTEFVRFRKKYMNVICKSMHMDEAI